ncbi:hypothetical protein BDN70DRAFT_887762 [Pholiota conissans]|uniref:Uncharacterized protein n=1 Tax=Pholiota conissans TaxID=109636 RepID=A0A9P6CMH3_9AGAR|nr:hypothetical protein BDN70DRAFT_887762 [Pholiota conissans]
MANSSAVGLPNPNTPLAFLDPTSAYQTSVSIYVLAGSLGVLLWDVLDNIGSDYKLLFKSRITFTTFVYFASRIGSLGYVIASNIFETAPTSNCKAFETITDAFYPVSLGFSALLFFIRLRAIYNRDRLVVAFFFILWLGLLGTTMIVPITILGANIGPTKYCIDADVPNAVYAAILSPLIHDTLVFIAITYRLVKNAHMEMGFKDGVAVAISGKYLPVFTRGLLKDGQKYYLLSLISNIVTVIMVFDTSVPIPMRSMCATPNIVITNIMACRVYRNTRFGLIREKEVATTTMKGLPKAKPFPLFPLFAHTKATTDGGFTGMTYDVPLSDITTKLGVASSTNAASTTDDRMMELKRDSLGDIESQSQLNKET